MVPEALRAGRTKQVPPEEADHKRCGHRAEGEERQRNQARPQEHRRHQSAPQPRLADHQAPETRASRGGSPANGRLKSSRSTRVAAPIAQASSPHRWMTMSTLAPTPAKAVSRTARVIGSEDTGPKRAALPP